MAITATVTPGKVYQSGDSLTVSSLNQLGTPTVNIEGAVGSLSLSDDSITNAHVQASAGILHSKLANLTSGNVLVGNATNVPTSVALTGDVTVSNTGATTIGAGAVEEGMLAAVAVTTAKVAGAAITTAKLAALDPSPAGSFTNSSVTVNSAGQVTAASSGGSPSVTVITSAGDWTKPTGVKLIQVTVFGAGGGGGDYSVASGGEAGDGGVVSDWIDVTSVTSVSVTIGTGGTGAQGGVNNGTDGTSSSFGSYLTGTGGIGGLQGAVAKAANGTVTGSQPTALDLESTVVNSTYHKGGLKGVNGSPGAVIVRVIG